jgi:hypothetical protein
MSSKEARFLGWHSIPHTCTARLFNASNLTVSTSPASEYVFDSTSSTQRAPPQDSPPATSNGVGDGISEDLEEGTGSILAKRLQRVVSEAERKWRDCGSGGEPNRTTYLSGALSMALCCILLTVFRTFVLVSSLKNSWLLTVGRLNAGQNFLWRSGS